MAEAVAAKGREWLRVEPDKTYGLGYVDTQFEVPYDFPPDLTWVAMAGAETVNKTIDHFTRLSHWKRYDKIPVKYFMSHLPNKEEIDTFNLAMKLKQDIGAVASATTVVKPVIVLCARIWFVRPLDVLNVDAGTEHHTGEADGFASELPEEYLAYIKEPKS